MAIRIDVAIVVAVGLDVPVVVFVLGMSQAISHDETVMPIISLGLTGALGRYGGKGSSISGRAPKADSCMTCGADGGGYAHAKGFVSPNGGPEPICESCHVKSQVADVQWERYDRASETKCDPVS